MMHLREMSCISVTFGDSFGLVVCLCSWPKRSVPLDTYTQALVEELFGIWTIH